MGINPAPGMLLLALWRGEKEKNNYGGSVARARFGSGLVNIWRGGRLYVPADGRYQLSMGCHFTSCDSIIMEANQRCEA